MHLGTAGSFGRDAKDLEILPRDASFFRSGSGEGLSEPVMEFAAVLGVFQINGNRRKVEIAQHDLKLPKII